VTGDKTLLPLVTATLYKDSFAWRQISKSIRRRLTVFINKNILRLDLHTLIPVIERRCQLLRLYSVGGRLMRGNDQGKPQYSEEKTSPSVTLSTTYLTQMDLGSNPNLRGDRPATNRMNHGPVRHILMFQGRERFLRYRRLLC
jgi:hypothetical protein